MPLKVAKINEPAPEEKGQGVSEPVRPVRKIQPAKDGAENKPPELNADTAGKDRLREARKAAKQLSEYSNRRLKFEYQEDANVFQVSVISGNGEIIRKVPPDSVLSMIENIRKYMGSTLDTKA
jgi:uncharacterized FlaG/YvyC family protein